MLFSEASRLRLCRVREIGLKTWLRAPVDHLIAALGPEDPEKRRSLRLHVFRVIAIAILVLGVSYIVWRYTSTLNLDALWFAIPVLLAETYGFFDHLLFIFQMWKPARRVPPPPLENVTLDVFITTYGEPVELVRLTAEAATRIRWPSLDVYILDDSTRPAMRSAAREIGCGYITRGDEWTGKARHAKAGNVSNALLQTDGEFILMLDADQIPAPSIAERTIGYFRDPQVSFVQTPQYFYNIPPADPFGSDAPLFYGPIQQGKDGWNAAFFCGSNALLRREALMQLGLTDYVQDMEARVRRSIGDLKRGTRNRAATPAQRAAWAALRPALDEARQALRQGQPLTQVSDMVREAVATAQRRMAEGDMAEIAEVLCELAAAGDAEAAEVSDYIDRHHTDLAAAISTSPESLGLSAQAVDDLALTRSDEAIPVMALPTISITEDMATAMRLHSLGWRSVFHPEILAYGLAPEDLGSALRQRLRWAEGTIQVLVRDNPLLKRGLTFAQRVQYFTSMYSYFSGFFTLILILAPIIYLLTGISPVAAWSTEFVLRIFPYLILSRIMFLYVARGLATARGEQYSVALFPLWIQAAIRVLAGAKLKFVVTPKQQQSGNLLPLVWPQALAICLTLVAIAYGLAAYIAGRYSDLNGILINVMWGCTNIWMLWAIVRAAVYKLPADWDPQPPAFLFPETQDG
jgi:cellulose synthase (UDP-forming)